MENIVPVTHSYPRLFTRQVLELWDYQWNPVRQQYDRVCFRPLHLFEDEANPQDPSDGEFYRPNPIMVNAVQRRMVPPARPPPPMPGARSPRPAIVPPARPPPPMPGARSPRPAIVAVPVASQAVAESPASPDPSEPYSPTDTPTKRAIPSPPAYSPNRLLCDRSYFVARQDHKYALPMDCPDNRPPRPAGPFSPANPPLQPAHQPRRTPIRRRAPSPPRAIGRGRGGPYPAGRVRTRGPIPFEDSAFSRPSLPMGRARNLFADFIPNIASPPSSPPPAILRTFPGPQPPRPRRHQKITVLSLNSQLKC
nr:formin-like protein 5 [Crassostrea gigas]